MNASDIEIRAGTAADLRAANTVVEAAVMTWDLPERVKRLSLPAYRYQAHDLEHLALVLAVDPVGAVVGVAAWEVAEPGDAPLGAHALLLHGIYVMPRSHRAGVGSRLLEAAETAAFEGGFDGLLVRAQRDAEGFFLKRDFDLLPVEDQGRDYPHRLWKSSGQRLAADG